jgi:hypothetical protein
MSEFAGAIPGLITTRSLANDSSSTFSGYSNRPSFAAGNIRWSS